MIGCPLGPFTAPSQSPVPARQEMSKREHKKSTVRRTSRVDAGIEIELRREACHCPRIGCPRRRRGRCRSGRWRRCRATTLERAELRIERGRNCRAALAGSVEVLERDKGGLHARNLGALRVVRREGEGDGRVVDRVAHGGVRVQGLQIARASAKRDRGGDGRSKTHSDELVTWRRAGTRNLDRLPIRTVDGTVTIASACPPYQVSLVIYRLSCNTIVPVGLTFAACPKSGTRLAGTSLFMIGIDATEAMSTAAKGRAAVENFILLAVM